VVSVSQYIQHEGGIRDAASRHGGVRHPADKFVDWLIAQNAFRADQIETALESHHAATRSR
jgi:hypothetical protein